MEFWMMANDIAANPAQHDAIGVEVFANLFKAVVDEMAWVVLRSSHTTFVKDLAVSCEIWRSDADDYRNRAIQIAAEHRSCRLRRAFPQDRTGFSGRAGPHTQAVHLR